MCIPFCSMISHNEIADVGIDFGFNHGLESASNRKNANVCRSSLPAA